MPGFNKVENSRVIFYLIILLKSIMKYILGKVRCVFHHSNIFCEKLSTDYCLSSGCQGTDKKCERKEARGNIGL
ncbi:MAG: hypothetical protein APR62_14220 [Smithella sp. SDB]|nr:MAG: hypothetical protein APR62_14220 [Smithella sp. SDB]